ncbi:hypothetical protein [Candidatus Nitrososphaera evergladensis]|nr:hypothetical protein [Candidatus Nitrososphaera evergladensis]
MQLKSTQQEEAFANIAAIINRLHKSHGYRIRGHEVHQTRGVMAKTSLPERAKMVSSFCARNGIRYLAYHSPILGRGQNIWEDKWREKVKESLALTIQEAQAVRKEAGLQSKVVIVFHLTSYMPSKEVPRTHKEKIALYEAAEQEFLKFFKSEQDTDGCVLAVENTYPRHDGDSESIGPFHPSELARMEKHGIMTALDLAHYQLYSNYLSRGKGRLAGDLDRERYGRAPFWDQCIKKDLASSLALLHISDASGFEVRGEALPVGSGEIPFADVLGACNSLGRDVRGTIELSCGHLQKGRLQFESARWLLENVPGAFKEA